MKRSLAAAAVAVLALTGCSSNQSGGDSNPDSQVEQPPLPSQDEDAGGRSQGPGATPS